MKVIILAAGKGSRLGNPKQPKPLTPLADGKSILEHQLENIAAILPLDNVLVVVGYRKELIMDTFPGLLFVYNAQYASENTSKSLLKALRKVDDDVLWLNGDVVFHPDILKKVKALGKTSMVVNVGQVGEEEVKYRLDNRGRICEVSKSVSEPKGEALGINFVQAKDVPLLMQGLESCQPNDYFEKGIEACIGKGMEVWSVPVDQMQCTEVDFPEDLDRANRYLASW